MGSFESILGERAVLPAATRRGWTLLELLVVIRIIGALFSVLLPAVQAARERARQSTCRNNLRQVAIACQTNHSVFAFLPQGQMWGPYGVGYDSTAWSFLARLLPHVERQDLYAAGGGIPHTTLRESKSAHHELSVFRCLSDPTPSPSTSRGNLWEQPIGLTNYKGVSGANWGADRSQSFGPGQVPTLWPNRGTNGSWDGPEEGDGMFFRTDYLVKRTDAHVLDGLSNTFMLGEDFPECDAYCSWPYANNAYSTCAIPPNQREVVDPADWPNVQGFRSYHPGGLHFALVDGSVHWIADAIDLALYRALATIRGQETVSVP
jgi:hypothetical protein